MGSHLIPADAGKIEQFDWGHIHWRVSGALGTSRTMTFGQVVIKAGRANPRHRHPNCDEILHLVSGRLEHSAEAERMTLNPGDTISVPAGTLHNAAAVGPQDAVAIIAFSSPDRQTVGE